MGRTRTSIIFLKSILIGKFDVFEQYASALPHNTGFSQPGLGACHEHLSFNDLQFGAMSKKTYGATELQ